MVALVSMPVLSGASKSKISASELKQRVAVLKRFKELLKAQRERFQAYLEALDKQRDVIEKGNADDLIQHVELEEKIVTDIFSIQKVIDPLEDMYQAARADFSVDVGNNSGEEVSSLKEALEGLKSEAVIRSERNRELLSKRMAELRSEIKTMRGNAYARSRMGFENAASATQIDIKG